MVNSKLSLVEQVNAQLIFVLANGVLMYVFLNLITFKASQINVQPSFVLVLHYCTGHSSNTLLSIVSST